MTACYYSIYTFCVLVVSKKGFHDGPDLLTYPFSGIVRITAKINK